jgi:histidine triad (HIT) family protein
MTQTPTDGLPGGQKPPSESAHGERSQRPQDEGAHAGHGPPQRPRVDTAAHRTKGPGSNANSASSPSGKPSIPSAHGSPGQSPARKGNSAPPSAHSQSPLRGRRANSAPMDPRSNSSALVENCAFCKILRGELPAKIIEDWVDAVCFIPNQPVAPGHVLVVPRIHVRNGHEDPQVTAATVLRAMENPHDLMRRAAAHIGKTLPDGNFPYNTIWSWGKPATQSVEHLHIHLVPRAEKDGLPILWTDQDKHPGCHNTTDHPRIKDSTCTTPCPHLKRLNPMTKVQQIGYLQKILLWAYHHFVMSQSV